MTQSKEQAKEQRNRIVLKAKIWLIRLFRNAGFLNYPKRKYSYKGITLPFYKAPLHGTSEGRLYIDANELFNSVQFRKLVDRCISSDLYTTLKQQKS